MSKAHKATVAEKAAAPAATAAELVVETPAEAVQAPTKGSALITETVPEEKRKSVTGRIRNLICSRPDISINECREILKAEGFVCKEVTLNIAFNEINAVLKQLRELGKLK